MTQSNSRLLLLSAVLAALAGCQTPLSRVKALHPEPPSAAAPAPVDPSFDWHVLVIAPFGSVLKDVPAALHEVLLFRDQDPGTSLGAVTPEDGDCYSADTPPPQFVGYIPNEYLLCFKRDRLSRIQATVTLPQTDAAAVFAAACAGWLKNAATPDASDPDAAAQSAAACEGRDGAVHFSAHLEREPVTTLSITLDGATDP